jgi:hypothetical protein
MMKGIPESPIVTALKDKGVKIDNAKSIEPLDGNKVRVTLHSGKKHIIDLPNPK